MSKIASLMMVVIFTLTTGCASTASRTNQTKPMTDQEAAQKRKEAITQMSLACGVGVAAIAILLGKKPEEVALLGAVAAAGCGIFTNQYTKKMEKKRKILQGRENDIDAQLKYARAVNSETRKYNLSTAAEIEKIDQQIKKGKVEKYKLTAIAYKLDEDKKNLDSTITDLKKYRAAILHGNQPSGKVNQLNQQISELEDQLSFLEKNMKRMASINRRVNA